MIHLTAQSLTWIQGAADDPTDQCAHGRVEFSVDGYVLVTAGTGEWTLSAAALYLLRSITDDHTSDMPIAEGNFLFPCCGFSVWVCGERYPVMAMGCNNGVNVWITHHGDAVELSTDSTTLRVPKAEWCQAVLAFVEQIEQFYARCSPKVELDQPDDRAGWEAFWVEWRQRAHDARRCET